MNELNNKARLPYRRNVQYNVRTNHKKKDTNRAIQMEWNDCFTVIG